MLMLWTACTPKIYTDQKFFTCAKEEFESSNSDKSQLFKAVLHHALLEEKDLPGYESLADPNRVYVLDLMYQTSPTSDSPEMTRVTTSELPSSVGEVVFCVKSKRELQEIADRAGAFMYLILGVVELTEQNAVVAIESQWQTSRLDPLAIADGGGYTCRFIQKDDQWTFDKKLDSWSM
ncbi:hypothetical protein C7460_12345 [Marinoscillum furvescens DSM 4134]|uniref:Uncharacterized protein n=2 Tax=Marinoscillum furvescens TaxID=1026 RepID=A0A3D9KXP5_MARFU|nr:hypothetical protein C7460_12345 [Marinoscillum furvescens DSM 4134]